MTPHMLFFRQRKTIRLLGWQKRIEKKIAAIDLPMNFYTSCHGVPSARLQRLRANDVPAKKAEIFRASNSG